MSHLKKEDKTTTAPPTIPLNSQEGYRILSTLANTFDFQYLYYLEIGYPIGVNNATFTITNSLNEELNYYLTYNCLETPKKLSYEIINPGYYQDFIIEKLFIRIPEFTKPFQGMECLVMDSPCFYCYLWGGNTDPTLFSISFELILPICPVFNYPTNIVAYIYGENKVNVTITLPTPIKTSDPIVESKEFIPARNSTVPYVDLHFGSMSIYKIKGAEESLIVPFYTDSYSSVNEYAFLVGTTNETSTIFYQQIGFIFPPENSTYYNYILGKDFQPLDIYNLTYLAKENPPPPSIPETEQTIDTWDVKTTIYDGFPMLELINRFFQRNYPILYGYTLVNATTSLYQSTFQVSQYSTQQSITLNNNGDFISTSVFFTPTVEDVISPLLLDIQVIELDSYLNLIRLTASDDLSNITTFSFERFYYNSFTKADIHLVDGTLRQGIFEFLYDTSNYTTSYGLTISIADQAINYITNNFAEYKTGRYLSPNLDKIIPGIKKYTNIKPKLSLQMGPFNEHFYHSGIWNSELEMYEIPFYLPKNTVGGILKYQIESFDPITSIYLFALYGNVSVVNIVSYQGDFLPPLVKSIIPLVSQIQYSTLGTQRLEWDVVIEDHPSGFNHGYFNITSSLDPIPFEVYMDTNSLKDGTIFNGTYRLSLDYKIQFLHPFNVFTISSAVLYDNGPYQLVPVFWKDVNSLQPVRLPDGTTKTITLECLAPQQSTPPPVLMAFWSNSTQIDVGSENRVVLIDFTIEKTGGIGSMNSLHNPKIYIESINTMPIGFESFVVDNSTPPSIRYNCLVNIPYAFGIGDVISFSIYQIIDTEGNVVGYSSSQLKTQFGGNSVKRINSMGAQLFKHTEITKEGGIIFIQGIGFGNDTSKLNFMVDFKNGTTSTYDSNDIIFQSGTVFSFNLDPFAQPKISIILSVSNYQTNQLWITPIKSSIEPHTPSPSSTPSPSESPNPTTSPQPIPCPGDCYGNGKCTENGCVCFSEWTGSDCRSKTSIINPIIPIDKPETNITDIDQQIVSIISIVSIRELDFQDKVIKEYHLKDWSFNNEIPYYKNHASVDPDFSVTLDYDSASSHKNSICGKSKFSTSKIAAIVVCGSAFIIAATIGAALFIRKNRKQKSAMRKINLKLQQANRN
eukprot:gene697-858_t